MMTANHSSHPRSHRSGAHQFRSHEEDVLNVQGHYAASKWEKNCRRHLGDHNFPPFDKYFILHHGIVL
ncbi:hypothetical protein Prudu_012396 [Prunus dulcis]|uniref:Uncharacterized protein n=1 Tax=Prunus dulcis TaxID=3755 RepID=A0A4Y1RCL4_PRUDU|nr:hypothetical protein Prudu_012396 [Prunus dulcis]